MVNTIWIFELLVSFKKKKKKKHIVYFYGKESTCNPETRVGSLGREDPWEGSSYSLQYSDLENPMECIVHGVAKSWTRLSDFHFHPFIIILITLLQPFFFSYQQKKFIHFKDNETTSKALI